MIIGREAHNKLTKVSVTGLASIFLWCFGVEGSWQCFENNFSYIPGVSDPVQARQELVDLLNGSCAAEATVKSSATAEAQADLPIGLVEGNGDEDDDRTKPFVPLPFPAARSQIEIVLRNPARIDRRQVTSYKDLGHLKVAPTKTTPQVGHKVASYVDSGHFSVSPAGEASISINYSLVSTARPLQTSLGGLFRGLMDV